MTPQERAALEGAYAIFQRMQEHGHPGRTAVPRLRKAAQDMQDALLPFEDDQGIESRFLLALLSAVVPNRAQYELNRDLWVTRELVSRIVAATADVPDGRGPAPDVDAQKWVMFAAGSWERETGQEPTTGTGHASKEHDVPDGADSPFLEALREFAKQRDTPLVTRDTLRKALPVWRALRGQLAG
jgi:hypothetical protein